MTHPIQSPPIVIAHHAGAGECPENTLFAIYHAQKSGIKSINLTVMMSKDNTPILFHGFDISHTTNGRGNPEHYTLQDLQKLDAGYTFHNGNTFPYRGQGIHIPSLEQALHAISANIQIILDIKTHKYHTLIPQLQHIIPAEKWQDIVFYSTDSNILTSLTAQYPHAHVFLNRDMTRKILLDSLFGNTSILQSIEKDDLQWIAFENTESMSISEHFTLGDASTEEVIHNLWNEKIIHSIQHHNPNAKLIMIGCNTYQDYLYAQYLGMYGVYTDFPTTISKL